MLLVQNSFNRLKSSFSRLERADERENSRVIDVLNSFISGFEDALKISCRDPNKVISRENQVKMAAFLDITRVLVEGNYIETLGFAKVRAIMKEMEPDDCTCRDEPCAVQIQIIDFNNSILEIISPKQ